MTMKTKDDYKKAFSIVRSLLMAWDPYRLFEGGAPDDEFDYETAEIVAKIPKMHSSEDAAKTISKVFSENFEPKYFSTASCVQVGRTLFAELEKEGLIQSN